MPGLTPRSILGKVKQAVLFLLGCLCALPVRAETPPSGHEVTLYDLVIEAEAGIARFRFLMPALGAGVGHAEVAGDLPWLCETVALPELRAEGWNVARVVVSVGDREVPLGTLDPEAVQFFETFTVETGACILELF